MEGCEMQKEIRFLVMALIVLLSTLLVMKIDEVRDLKREREAYGWRQYTCKTLLSDPKTCAIMCAK
jgi:hypothetical protein